MSNKVQLLLELQEHGLLQYVVKVEDFDSVMTYPTARDERGVRIAWINASGTLSFGFNYRGGKRHEIVTQT